MRPDILQHADHQFARDLPTDLVLHTAGEPCDLLRKSVRAQNHQREKSKKVKTPIKKTYSAADIADLYYRRWDVELFFRDIKTSMGMDILRCRTPTMVRKEILMHLIVYNSIRLLMLAAAKQVNVSPRQISFKASVQALRQWEPMLSRNHLSARERLRLMVLLREAIAATILLSRPGRKEPRCVKRRRKNFQLMTAPRHEMREIPHRSEYRAKRS